jgi:hypothetical protein
MENRKPDGMTPLSASRIKTLENCSWLYWVNYHLKLPQIQNEGAKKGDICHRVFELLLDKKHNKKFKKIITSDSITEIPAIERLIKIYAKKLQLELNHEKSLQIHRMIMVGLKTDFFVKGGKIISPEYKFEIYNENPEYLIKGFIDKPAVKKDTIIIDDFKSSKKKYEGEDNESNIQAMMYSLASTKLWPDKKPLVRFIFLQFPEEPLMPVSFNSDTLKGFEYYLASIQKRVNEFSEGCATRDFAFDKANVGAGEFKGKLICGYATYPNQKKKDGNPMWHCPYKFAFHYYAIKKNDVLVYTTFDANVVLKEGETIHPMKYDGCPKFRNVLNNFDTPTISIKGKPEFVNVLDDF